jgi:hypothetical protein
MPIHNYSHSSLPVLPDYPPFEPELRIAIACCSIILQYTSNQTASPNRETEETARIGIQECTVGEDKSWESGG